MQRAPLFWGAVMSGVTCLVRWLRISSVRASAAVAARFPGSCGIQGRSRTQQGGRTQECFNHCASGLPPSFVCCVCFPLSLIVSPLLHPVIQNSGEAVGRTRSGHTHRRHGSVKSRRRFENNRAGHERVHGGGDGKSCSLRAVSELFVWRWRVAFRWTSGRGQRSCSVSSVSATCQQRR